jgi:hypothetical protein
MIIFYISEIKCWGIHKFRPGRKSIDKFRPWPRRKSIYKFGSWRKSISKRPRRKWKSIYQSGERRKMSEYDEMPFKSIVVLWIFW